MMTLYWFAFNLWKRFTCRTLGWHQWGVTISHGYVLTFCGRCWSFTLEALPEPPAAGGGVGWQR